MKRKTRFRATTKRNVKPHTTFKVPTSTKVPKPTIPNIRQKPFASRKKGFVRKRTLATIEEISNVPIPTFLLKDLEPPQYDHPEFEKEENVIYIDAGGPEPLKTRKEEDELTKLIRLSAPIQILGGDDGAVKLEDIVDEFGLSKEQRVVFDMAMTGESFFFTGSAGTGKSHTMKIIVKHLSKTHENSVFVTASTGSAACNIGGTTLHSFAGIGLGKGTVDSLFKKISKNPVTCARWKSVRTLIIDEISMIDSALFDKLEELARRMKSTLCKPFGGIQVILCGDFFQLPPVRGRPTFQASSWKKVVRHCVELRGNFRQRKDFEFAQILNYLRFGVVTPEAKSILDGCLTPHDLRRTSQPAETDENSSITEEITTTLYPHRADVESENQAELRKLDKGPKYVYNARDIGKRSLHKLFESCPAPKILSLKLDAHVVMVKNIDFDRGLVNGAQGIVVGFDIDTAKSPIVKFSNGLVAKVRETMWEVKMGGQKAARFQVPLTLGYALSIHKSQGMTLDRVRMKLSSVWEKGQAYVALSRVSTASGLHLMNYDLKKIRANNDVIEFHKSIYREQLDNYGKE